VQKRGKERGRSWLISGPLLVTGILSGIIVVWLTNRDVNLLTLKYGELVQVLQSARNNPAVRVQNVRVGRTEIRGDIVTSDPVSGDAERSQLVKAVPFHTLRLGLEDDRDLHRLLREAAPGYQGEEEESPLKGVGTQIFLFITLIGMAFLAILLFRWFSGGSSLMFGRSRHKLYAQKDTHTTFNDVAGIEEAMAELREVVDFLKNPTKYQALGGRIPKGVLLVGPPGTGKTLLAKAVAGEADAPFFSLSGSDFVEMFVGVGAARVRDLFAQAESRAPCIIFIDELDALGKTRTGAAIGGHDEREQTLNQLLVEMDGFESNRGVIIMAATNRPETLDPALLRPGRFADVDLRHVASLTPGSVGADLANLVNEAALMAARNGKDAVAMAEFDEAVERGAVGLERKSRIMHADEKQRVAYHEAGHALVACALPNTHPVHKVSIIPRGIGALGYVLRRPEDDRYLMTQSELESNIKVALAGTLAEELTFHEISNGATSDLEQASNIARRMVKEFGMSPMGRVNFQEQGGPQFLGVVANAPAREFSEQTAREIDLEVRRIIEDATNEVRAILSTRQGALEAVAQRLIDKEVIDGAELRQLLEEHNPGPHIVPGSDAVDGRTGRAGVAGAAESAAGISERVADGGAGVNPG
jgi:cell division protease FtsH